MKNKIKKRILPVIILSLVIFFSSINVIFAESGSPDAQEEYINILEKTNQQLSLFWNPYNIILTILTALFTILTIIFAVVFYFQSMDYKKRIAQDKEDYKQKIDDFLKKQQEYAKKLIDERIIEFKKIETKYNNSISELEKKRKALPREQKHKIEEIEKSIENLKTEKELLKFQTEPISAMPDYNFPATSILGRSSFHKCSHCGFGFKIKDYDYNDINDIRATASIPNSILGATTVVCPMCGNADQI